MDKWPEQSYGKAVGWTTTQLDSAAEVVVAGTSLRVEGLQGVSMLLAARPTKSMQPEAQMKLSVLNDLMLQQLKMQRRPETQLLAHSA